MTATFDSGPLSGHGLAPKKLSWSLINRSAKTSLMRRFDVEFYTLRIQLASM